MTDSCAYSTTTSDCKECDFRLAFVPARTHEAGSMRPIYEVRFTYPHVVSNRSTTWRKRNLQGSESQLSKWDTTKPIGYIPQVPSTNALYETGSSYGLINEHGVSMGESTCPAVFVSKPVSDGGHALFDVSELSKVALERAKTARQAIEIMGQLAVNYGYYGAEWNDERNKYSEAGESLSVADKNEAWIFHVLPDDTGKSAIWAAQKLQPGHITAVGNFFIIRGIKVKDSEFYLYSDNMFSISKRHGIRKNDADGYLDFSSTFGLMDRPHSSYTTLRRWRILTIADPSLAAVMNSTTTTDVPNDFPFSTRVVNKLTPADIVAIQRDHFEGTVYDLTKSIAAGPYGDPDRYDAEGVGDMSHEKAVSGEFARGISMFRTSYSSVSRSCAHLPKELSAMIRFAQQQPDTSTFIPLYVSSEMVPRELSRGSLFRFDMHSYFWRVLLVSNWAHKYYSHANPIIRKVQQKLEREDELKTFEDTTANVLLENKEKGLSLIAEFSMKRSKEAYRTYLRLFGDLVAKIHDGYIMKDADAEDITMQSFFYPEEWLNRVGYFTGRETSAAKGREAIRRARNRLVGGMFGRNIYGHKFEEFQSLEHMNPTPHVHFWSGMLFGIAICSAMYAALQVMQKHRRGYSEI